MKKIDGVEYYTLAEAAEKMGYCIQHLRRLCHKGKYAALKRGREFLFTPEMLTAMAPQLVFKPYDPEVKQ
jgi:hypothetical protein